MTDFSNRFEVLAKNNGDEDHEVTFNTANEVTFNTANVNGLVSDALGQLKEREGRDIGLIEDVVKAVVAAVVPMFETLCKQVATPRKIESSQKLINTIQRQQQMLDEAEQYSKRDNILINGVAETNDENTDDIVRQVGREIGVSIKEIDISISHRIGRRGAKPRPIVAKFVRRSVRNEMLRNRKNLKGNKRYPKVFIDEHLTQLRSKMLKMVREDPEVDSTWSIGGKVWCKKKGEEEKRCINSPEELFSKLNWTEEKIKNSGLFLDI